MATDYWVKRFGFMWAGGRSGMKGMEALQVRLGWTVINITKVRCLENCRLDLQQRDPNINLQSKRYLWPEGYGGELKFQIGNNQLNIWK